MRSLPLEEYQHPGMALVDSMDIYMPPCSSSESGYPLDVTSLENSGDSLLVLLISITNEISS
ncbi:predicted protein [Botrytis cinerea T4]|uniref:Uncharacterized protein n=1 Tax=Botryotinia fuckeliana (strain T4) TaxID=999810 RepID=G2YPC9_BOTF4|nr:predicted protein [Botrytis cinerea T4]